MSTGLPLANAVRGALPLPSDDEANFRYLGLPSRPYFIARSSLDVWTAPIAIDESLARKELRTVGKHPLCDVWEGKVDLAMHRYLVEQTVQYTSLDPVRIGIVNEPTAPLVIWVGVEHGTLSAERGVKVANDLRSILLQHGIDDVHIEIRASVVTSLAKMYTPVFDTDPTVLVREPFTTTLGIPICSEQTPHIQGTATFFFTVSSKPDKLFLLAPRHVLFQVDEENSHYEYDGSAPRRNVLLLSTPRFEARVKDIEDDIQRTKKRIERSNYQKLKLSSDEDSKETRREQNIVQGRLNEAEDGVKELEHFLDLVNRDWKDPKNRLIGHVVLSPPLTFSAGAGRFTQDVAVIEVDTSMIDANNFVGNAIDLGTISNETLTGWMRPHSTADMSFTYPPNRLLQFCGILSDVEMSTPNPENVDSRGDPTIMVIKRGGSSGLTVGCLNNIRSVLRTAFKTRPAEYSREVAVLSRTSQSGPFSDDGDSGAVVVSGAGAVVGMITSGSTPSKRTISGALKEPIDCSYVTPISFLLECLEQHGFPANIFFKDTKDFI